MKISPTFFKKQKQVLRLLMNFGNGISEILFGGAAGGGKSRVGCSWIISMAIMFPGTRYLIGRAKLLALKQTTLKTFFEVAKEWGLKEGVHWSINNQTNTITFANKSEIILKDLFLYPSDPDFDSLGSLEITAAFIDEAPQITEKAKNIVSSRIRFMLDVYCGHCGNPNEDNEVLKTELREGFIVPVLWKCSSCNKETEGITPKTLMTCNPSQNWVYIKFYKLFKDGKLEDYKAFIQSFVTDNPFISKHYIKNLEKLDKLSRLRLLKGFWEYSDELALFGYDEIIEVIATKRKVDSERFFMSVDVARLGKDSTVIVVISSTLEVVKLLEFKKLKVTETIKEVQKLKDKYNVDEYDIAIDSDGVGGGVADHFENAVAIVNVSRALLEENYQNLKTQLYFKLSELMNEKAIAFNSITDEQAEKLVQELQQMKREKADQDGKVQMTKKEDVKKLIGRSPDYSDALAYAMYFFLEDLDDEYISF